MFRSVYAVLGYLMLLAAVSANAYTINYNLNGGVNHPENPESYDEAAGRFDLKEPTREGYSFLGWYIEFAEGVDVPPNMYYGEYQDYSMFVLANYLGSFSVYARWGLVPQTPKQDERGCYLIYTAEELYGIATVSIADSTAFSKKDDYKFEGCISLQNDIVVNENLLDSTGNLSREDFVWWVPLKFKGTFEGNGFKISGLRGNDGLFVTLGDENDVWGKNVTVVRNLGVTDSYFSGSDASGIVGKVVGLVQMTNVYADVSIQGLRSTVASSTPAADSVQFEIHYVLNGGENSELNPAGYAKGDSAIVLADPQKENDEFEGWFLDEDFTQRVDTIKTEHYGDWTLYAKWKSYFVVDIEMNGGQFYNGTEFYKPHVVKWSADSAAYVLGKAYWSGFEFAGWYADSLLEQEITEIPAGNTEDLTVYAKWNTTEYTITYHMNGGENSLENLTAFNAADVGFEFKAPAREGAKFYRWTPEKLSYYSAVQLTEKKSIDLFAEWTPAPQMPEQDTAGCYHLKNKEELYWFAGLVNGTLDSTVRNPKACATLDSDIVINENMWQDSALNLDDSLTYFVWDAIWDYEGTFLGNGHSITGLLANSSCGDEHLFAGLFCNASSYKNVVNVKVNGSYVQEFGYIDNFVITGGTMPAQPGTLQGEWRAVVGGKSVSLFGLAPGKMLFVYDLQGRLLRRERTEPTMLMDFMDAGKFLIRYGNETRAVTIR